MMKYYYKRKSQADDLQAIEDQGIGAAIRDQLNDRFLEQNNELISQFEQDLQKETAFLGVLMQNAFQELLDKAKEDFFAELEKKNMDSFNKITETFIDGVYQDRRSGKGIENTDVATLVKQAQNLFDKEAYSNFKTISEKYLTQVKDEIASQVGGASAVAEY